MNILIAHKLHIHLKTIETAIRKHQFTPSKLHACDNWFTLLLSLRNNPDIDICIVDLAILAPDRLSNIKLMREQFVDVSLILIIDKIARFNATPFFEAGVAACLKRGIAQQSLVQTVGNVHAGQRNIAIYH